MKIIFKLYLLSLIVLFASCISDEVPSNGDIAGVIKDASTNQTLQGCLITLSPSGNTISTGSDGLYSFNSLLPTSYSLEVRKEGYKAEKKEVTVTPGQTSKVDIFLSLNKAELSVTPEVLDFGELITSKDLFISNSTKVGSIRYSIKTNADWLSLSSTDGIVSTNTNKVTVMVNRDALSTGSYEKKLTIASAGSEIEVPIVVKQVEKTVARILIGDFSHITESSFTINGTMLSLGGIKVTSHGHCWGQSDNPTVEDFKTNLGDIQEAGVFMSQANGLISGKTYFVRAYAINSIGVSYSNEQKIITMPINKLPVVATGNLGNIGPRSAELNGIIMEDGNSEITESGFYWGADKNTSIKQVVSPTENKLFYILKELTPNTTYYYKAYAKNKLGTSYGNMLSFNTLEKSLIVHISSTGNDKNDGETWDTAKENIFYTSLGMKSGQEMWIKKGIYKQPIASGLNGIKIYGSFDGTEHSLSQRNSLNETILQFAHTSDEIEGDNLTIDGVIIDGKNTYPPHGIIHGLNIAINNCIIRNVDKNCIFNIPRGTELTMKSSVIENCGAVITNENASFRFYDCIINAPIMGYRGKYFFYRTTFNGTYYEEYVIDNNK